MQTLKNTMNTESIQNTSMKKNSYFFGILYEISICIKNGRHPELVSGSLHNNLINKNEKLNEFSKEYKVRVMFKYVYSLIFFVLLICSASLQVNSQQYTKEQPLLQQGNINCFVYHRFGDDRYPSTNISVEDFTKHLDYLKSNEYNVVTFGEAVSLLDSNTPVPNKTVCLTVDDGYKSFYENALPLLREFTYPATIFINTDKFGSGDFLTVD